MGNSESDRNHAELIEEARYDRYQENLQEIDRVKHGFCLCPNCGNKTNRVIFCEEKECRFAGCSNCMVYDKEENEWFCSDEHRGQNE